MNVMIAVEDETTGALLVDYVASRTWNEGTEFIVVHAVEPLDIDDFLTAVYGQTEQKGILEKRVTKAREFVEKLAANLARRLADYVVHSEVMIGKPREVILYLAQTYKSEQIVIGSHGRGALGRFFLGSVSLAVVSAATCTTTIIRTAQHKNQQEQDLHAVAFDAPNGNSFKKIHTVNR
jgi:nucleotide-binding universal stress UspA family protein